MSINRRDLLFQSYLGLGGLALADLMLADAPELREQLGQRGREFVHTRFTIAKPEPLRTEHEAFRDAVLGKDADIVTSYQHNAKFLNQIFHYA